jgi:hypothetical protein
MIWTRCQKRSNCQWEDPIGALHNERSDHWESWNFGRSYHGNTQFSASSVNAWPLVGEFHVMRGGQLLTARLKFTWPNSTRRSPCCGETRILPSPPRFPPVLILSRWSAARARDSERKSVPHGSVRAATSQQSRLAGRSLGFSANGSRVLANLLPGIRWQLPR